MALVRISSGSGSGLAPGLQIGRYELECRVGRGGMGEVWKGRHVTLGSAVAIKFDLGGHDPKRFVQEGRVAASLTSSRICRVLDEGIHEDQAYLVMEFLEGETLAERLLSEGRIAPEELVSIFDDVAEGLACAHAAGVVHRDLKPSNIFLLRDGLAKLLDFGVARVEGADYTSSGQFLGTMRYVSPEQARDARKVTARSDLWSLGAIAYECLVGKRLFQGDSPPEILDAVCHRDLPTPSEHGPTSVEFDEWFAGVMQRDPEQRPASIEEFVTTLRDAVLEPQPDAVARPSRFEMSNITSTQALGTPPQTGSTSRSRAIPSTLQFWLRYGSIGAAIAAAGFGLLLWQQAPSNAERAAASATPEASISPKVQSATVDPTDGDSPASEGPASANPTSKGPAHLADSEEQPSSASAHDSLTNGSPDGAASVKAEPSSDRTVTTSQLPPRPASGRSMSGTPSTASAANTTSSNPGSSNKGSSSAGTKPSSAFSSHSRPSSSSSPPVATPTTASDPFGYR